MIKNVKEFSQHFARIKLSSQFYNCVTFTAATDHNFSIAHSRNETKLKFLRRLRKISTPSCSFRDIDFMFAVLLYFMSELF